MEYSNLASLRLLKIEGCPDLVSVGGSEAIAGIASVIIDRCPKFKEFEQPVLKRRQLREINVVRPNGTWIDTCSISVFLSTACIQSVD